MGRCENCLHWKQREETYDLPRGWGECDKTWLQPDAQMGGFGGAEVPKDTLAMATDWSSYKAVLQTAPNFGCVQFEEVSDG